MKIEILKQQQKVAQLSSELSQAQANLLELQKKYINQTKIKILRKYLNQFKTTPLYKFDPELISVIFKLAGIQESSNSIKIGISSEGVKITYLNKRLDTWHIL